MSCLSHRPSDPVDYIEDCRIFGHQLIQWIGHWSQTIGFLGPRDFSKKLAGRVSLNNDEGLYEEFDLLNPSQKSLVLLDSGITQDLAEELLMREEDPTIFLTSEVIEKFDKNCDEECQQKYTIIYFLGFIIKALE